MLGTTRSRLHRAIRAAGIEPARSPGGHVRLDRGELRQLRRRLGVAPRTAGLSREQVLVLAALARRPLGLGSGRAVARAAGVSPTTANGALAHLAAMDLVVCTSGTVAAGRARLVDRFTVNWRHPRWPELAPQLAGASFPVDPVDAGTPPSRGVPAWLGHLFWNQDLDRLDVDHDRVMIAARVLASDDLNAHAWAARTLAPEAWRSAARTRGVDARRTALAAHLADLRW